MGEAANLLVGHEFAVVGRAWCAEVLEDVGTRGALDAFGFCDCRSVCCVSFLDLYDPGKGLTYDGTYQYSRDA